MTLKREPEGSVQANREGPPLHVARIESVGTNHTVTLPQNRPKSAIPPAKKGSEVKLTSLPWKEPPSDEGYGLTMTLIVVL